MRGSTFRFQPVSNQSGSLDVFIAAALVLPVILLTLFGGWVGLQLGLLDTELAGARQVGAEVASIQGGVTPTVVADVKSALSGTGIPPQEVQISGTGGPVPWGSPVSITVVWSVPFVGFPYNVMGLEGVSARLGGTSRVTSNLVPPGP